MKPLQIEPKPLYIFLDEGGNLDFSPSGTKYFTLTSVAAFRPFSWDAGLVELRYEMLESGLDLEVFHASEDKQQTRNKVFATIAESLTDFRADSVIVEKAKAAPELREVRRFYPEMVGYLLRHVFAEIRVLPISQIIVITDAIPVQRKRNVVEKAVKETLANMLPADIAYRIAHRDSKSYAGLQIADYVNWAIYRFWDSNDVRSLDLIRDAVKNQYEIFNDAQNRFY